LEFVVTVEVFPTVIIDQFEGVSVVKKAAEITDLDIESMIVKLQKQRAEWQSVLDSDVSLEGDRLKIDFSGLIDGKPFEGGSGENVQLELGSKTFIPGFEDQLIGLKQGYEGSITVTFPEDYVETSLRGKVAEFNTTIKNIERKKLPEVDKEFIKTFSISSGDIDEFRKYVKENMHREMVTRTEQLARNQLLDQLIAKHPFEVPKALVHHQLQFEKQQFNQQMGGQLNEEILAKIFNDNEELSKKALLTVKRALIVDCMTGQLASRDVTDEEREKKASELVVGLENAEEVKQWYFSNKKAKNNLDHLILEDKSFDLLFSKVSVEIQTLPYDEVMALSN
jgi:trigger factor